MTAMRSRHPLLLLALLSAAACANCAEATAATFSSRELLTVTHRAAAHAQHKAVRKTKQKKGTAKPTRKHKAVKTTKHKPTKHKTTKRRTTKHKTTKPKAKKTATKKFTKQQTAKSTTVKKPAATKAPAPSSSMYPSSWPNPGGYSEDVALLEDMGPIQYDLAQNTVGQGRSAGARSYALVNNTVNGQINDPSAGDPVDPAGGAWRVIGLSGSMAIHTAPGVGANDQTILFYERSRSVEQYLKVPNPNNPRQNVLEIATRYSLTTNNYTIQHFDDMLFCGAAIHLDDGTLYMAGGESNGASNTSYLMEGKDGSRIFDFATGNVQYLTPMDSWRWYPSLETLANGKVIIVGGSIMLGGGYGQVASNVNISNPTYQVFDPVAKNFAGPQQFLLQLNQTWPINLYPHLFTLPNSHELFIMAGKQSRVYTYDTNGILTLSTTNFVADFEVPVSFPFTTTALMLPLDPATNYTATVAVIGGSSKDRANENTTASDTVQWVTFDGSSGTKQWTVEHMATPRVMPDAVMYPDGNVLISNGCPIGIAGGAWGNGFCTGDATQPQWWYPKASGSARFGPLLTSSKIDRFYHSFSFLKPDGKFVMGGSEVTLDFRIQEYTPPQLLTGLPQPILVTTPLVINYNTPFKVTINTYNPIVRMVLYRTGSITHSMHMDQRQIVLQFSTSAATINAAQQAQAQRLAALGLTAGRRRSLLGQDHAPAELAGAAASVGLMETQDWGGAAMGGSAGSTSSAAQRALLQAPGTCGARGFYVLPATTQANAAPACAAAGMQLAPVIVARNATNNYRFIHAALLQCLGFGPSHAAWVASVPAFMANGSCPSYYAAYNSSSGSGRAVATCTAGPLPVVCMPAPGSTPAPTIAPTPMQTPTPTQTQTPTPEPTPEPEGGEDGGDTGGNTGINLYFTYTGSTYGQSYTVILAKVNSTLGPHECATIGAVQASSHETGNEDFNQAIVKATAPYAKNTSSAVWVKSAYAQPTGNCTYFFPNSASVSSSGTAGTNCALQLPTICVTPASPPPPPSPPSPPASPPPPPSPPKPPAPPPPLPPAPLQAQTYVLPPPDRTVARPGYYMLFLVDSKGTPSVAKWVRLLDAATPAPTAAPS